MRSRCGRCAVAVAVLAGCLLVLPCCHRAQAKSPLLYVLLTYNNGVCEQNGSSDVVAVAPDQAVIYQAASMLRDFQVRFTTCPFASCPADSPHERSENVGRPNPGTAGATFTYSGLTMSGQPCQNAGAMGVRVTSGS
jgi:hypothetical protein